MDTAWIPPHGYCMDTTWIPHDAGHEAGEECVEVYREELAAGSRGVVLAAKQATGDERSCGLHGQVGGRAGGSRRRLGANAWNPGPWRCSF